MDTLGIDATAEEVDLMLSEIDLGNFLEVSIIKPKNQEVTDMIV